VGATACSGHPTTQVHLARELLPPRHRPLWDHVASRRGTPAGAGHRRLRTAGRSLCL